MFGDVLVPTDGSPGAEAALARAFDLARTGAATLHVLYVVDTRDEPRSLEAGTREELRSHAEKRGREATARIRERAAERGIETVRAVREGSPHRAIVDYADENDVGVVVMGTHGQTHGDGTRLGSTAERVVTLAEVPVLTVRLDEDADVPQSGYGMYDHVVVATDGSDAAERAGYLGLEIAERYGADLHVVYVVDTTTYGLRDAPRSIVGLLEEAGETAVAELAAEARDRNLPVTTDVLRGVPDEEIVAYADGVDADLITVGARGRRAEADGFLGSTTARIVGRSGVPVLTATSSTARTSSHS
jgi:nucleotide-binding universal stress UspA family protein